MTGLSHDSSGTKYECIVYSAFVLLKCHSMIRVCLVGGKIEWIRGGEGISKWNSYLGHVPFFFFPSYFLSFLPFFFFRKEICFPSFLL